MQACLCERTHEHASIYFYILLYACIFLPMSFVYLWFCGFVCAHLHLYHAIVACLFSLLWALNFVYDYHESFCDALILRIFVIILKMSLKLVSVSLDAV